MATRIQELEATIANAAAPDDAALKEAIARAEAAEAEAQAAKKALVEATTPSVIESPPAERPAIPEGGARFAGSPIYSVYLSRHLGLNTDRNVHVTFHHGYADLHAKDEVAAMRAFIKAYPDSGVREIKD